MMKFIALQRTCLNKSINEGETVEASERLDKLYPEVFKLHPECVIVDVVADKTAKGKTKPATAECAADKTAKGKTKPATAESAADKTAEGKTEPATAESAADKTANAVDGENKN